MAGIFSEAVGVILDNYADVIEGGNAHRGSGTAYKGFAGSKSNDPGIRGGADTPLTATGGSTTTVVVAGTYSWDSERWIKTEAPGYFLRCRTATDQRNVDAARRITAWNNTTKTFTVDAFPAAVVSGDTFEVHEGFKRIPNGIDILTEEASMHGWDRFFHLECMAGQHVPYYGAGVETYETTMRIRLRILKYAREHDAKDSAFQNLMALRSVITIGKHRGDDFVMMLSAEDREAEEIRDDESKAVFEDRYKLVYRVNSTFI